eukprot:12250136-Heterocapsa_arctica.AAC.1
MAEQDEGKVAGEPCTRERVGPDFGVRGEGHREARKRSRSLLASPRRGEHRASVHVDPEPRQ